MLFKTAKRVVIFVLGITVLLIGVALIVLPGPAIVVIPLGLAILASEFAWARYGLHKYKDTSVSIWSALRMRFAAKPPPRQTQELTPGDSSR